MMGQQLDQGVVHWSTSFVLTSRPEMEIVAAASAQAQDVDMFHQCAALQL